MGEDRKRAVHGQSDAIETPKRHAAIGYSIGRRPVRGTRAPRERPDRQGRRGPHYDPDRDAGETLNQLQPTRVLLSPASAPYSSCRQLSSALNTVPGTLTRS